MKRFFADHARLILGAFGLGFLAFALPALGADGAPAGGYIPGTSGLTLPSLTNFAQGAKPGDIVGTLRIVMMMTVLTLAPAILIMTTSFTRIVVVLSFLRQAIGTQQMPPNQLIVGLSLFLTFFVMAPTWQQVSTNSIEPYMAEKIDPVTAWKRAEAPIREFMFGQTREKDLELFLTMAKLPKPTRARTSRPTRLCRRS